MPPTVDLLTEIRQVCETPALTGVSVAHQYKSLFLKCLILFKYCTEMKITLPDGHLGIPGGAYSQSYPQILWVMNFLFCSKSLKAYAKTVSSIGRQAIEPA